MKNYILNILLYKYQCSAVLHSCGSDHWAWSPAARTSPQILWWPSYLLLEDPLPIALVGTSDPRLQVHDFSGDPHSEPLPHSSHLGKVYFYLEELLAIFDDLLLTWRPRVLTNTQLSKCPSVSWAANIRTGSFILPLSPLKLTRGGWGGQGGWLCVPDTASALLCFF